MGEGLDDLELYVVLVPIAMDSADHVAGLEVAGLDRWCQEVVSPDVRQCDHQGDSFSFLAGL